MNKQQILMSWKQASELTEIFAGYPRMLSSDEKQTYDDLFRGTLAGVQIPLWASLCCSDSGCLMDETTLKIVQYYHRFGYRQAEMDKNPPDYIGQMYRFLCYLYACALHGGEGSESFAGAAGEFAGTYLKPTAAAVAAGIRRYAETGYFSEIAGKIEQFACTAGNTADTAVKQKISMEEDLSGAGLQCVENYRLGPDPKIPDGEAQRIFTAGRNNCGGRCPLETTVQDGCLTALKASSQIGLPGLHACIRHTGYRRTYLSPERLRYPMKRIGKRGEGHFQRISWGEAEELLTSEWIRIRDTYGPGSRMPLYGWGVSAVMRPNSLLNRLLSLDGGYLDHYGSYSSIQTVTATPYAYGDFRSGNSVEDLANTKLLILWGHNPAETIFSPQIFYYISKAKERGARVIVIDPRRSDSAEKLADEWIPIRPSTDAALAAALARVILSEGIQDQAFMDRYCLGFDGDHMPEGVPAELNYQAYLSGETDGIEKSPEWAESITGVPADTIRRLAREYAAAKPACLLPGLGYQRTEHGEQATLALIALCCLTGNVGIPGGGSAGSGISAEEKQPVFPMPKNPYPGSISCYVWTDAIRHGSSMTAADGVRGMDRLASDARMVFCIAGNVLINQHSDIPATQALLQDETKAEFIVCSDVFMTPSARFADLLLPAPSFLEEDNITGPWRSGHYLLSNHRTIDPLFDSRSEYEWIGELARRLGLWEEWSEGHVSMEDWLREIYGKFRGKNKDIPDYDMFREKGGFAYKDAKPYIAFEAQIRDPEHHPFGTPSGKIEIFSKQLYDRKDPMIPALPVYIPAVEGPESEMRRKYPLQLFAWHTRRRCHTIHDNNPQMERLEPQRLWLHPADAGSRGISDGDLAEVFNDRGSIRIRVTVTDRIMQGTAAMPQGAWYTPGPDGVDTRGSINVLTAYRPTALAKGNPQHTNLAEVRRI
ncbi:MAG: molybdopterin-dependent oxidoreductase [Lachnospiraceae bacterium]|nr:molybdopterin-dependent oxidoreductase [Lachnospiraceae bacterium]